MDFKTLREIVKENAKGFEYEIYLLEKERTKIATENGEFEKINSAKELGLALRLQRGKRVGFAYTTDLTPQSLKKFVKDLCEITALVPEEEGRGFIEEKLPPEVETSPFDEGAVKKSVEEKIDLVVNFERNLIKSHPYVVGTRETSFTETVYSVLFENSFGVSFSYRGTAYSIVTSLLAQSPSGDRNISWGYRAARYLKDLNLSSLADELVKKVTETLDPKPFESKNLPVIFHREAFASLLETFAPIFSGENALKGKTPLKGREGEAIAPPFVSIFDDGTLKGGLATHPYDDEGFPQRKTPLVEGGIFKGFYHSLYSARKLGKEPTGNGFRSSFTSPPRAQISNLYIAGEGVDFEELLKGKEEAILVYDLMGLHTADPISGDFSLGANGVYYRKGKKVQALRGITVAGNFLKLLSDIEALGNEPEFYGSVGSPSVLVKNITVGGI